MASQLVFTPDERRLVREARRAVLATIAADGSPRLVPICFVVDDAAAVLYSPLDEKPKRELDPRRLARVRDIARDPRVSVLFDRWDESWARLAWLRCLGRARLIEPRGDDLAEHGRAVRALRERYPQYATHALDLRPILRIDVDRTSSWGAL
jgi:PPOX class probable F420-dependent enzyme